MTKTFEFLFDFGGPNSYLAHKALPDLCAQTGAQAVYVPVLLGGLFKITNNQAPMIRYAETPAKRNYEMLEFDRFVKRHHLPFRMNPHFPINSLHLMRGAVAARLHPATPELRIAVLPSGKVVGPEARAFLLPTAWKTMVFVSLLLLLAKALHNSWGPPSVRLCVKESFLFLFLRTSLYGTDREAAAAAGGGADGGDTPRPADCRPAGGAGLYDMAGV